MKVLILSTLCMLSLSSWAQSTVVLKCDHVSEDNWPLGGTTPTMVVEFDEEGMVMSGTLDGEVLSVAANSNSLIRVETRTSSNYTDTYYYFKAESLLNLRLGDVSQVEVSNSNYMAAFNEDVDCTRIQ